MAITFVRYLGRAHQDAALTAYHAAIFRRTRALGWRNLLVCAPPPPADPQLIAPLVALGVELVYIPRPQRNFDAAVARAAWQLCREVRADILHCDNIHTSPLLGAWLARVPVRLWFKRAMLKHFEEERSPGWRERLMPSVRASVALATTVVTVSEAVRDELLGFGFAAEKFEVLLNPVPRQPIGAAERAAARRRFGFTEDELVILTVGHAVPVKGWDVLLEAFARAAWPASRRACLVFVGSVDAPHERETFAALERRRTVLGLDERTVRFTGHLDEVRPALAAADLYVQPSRSEGNCNALNEAYGAGLACIATAVGFAPRLIRDGENGLLVPRGDPEPLARALARLAQDSALRARLASAARNDPLPAGTPLSWDDYYDRLVDLYRRCAERALPHRSSSGAKKELCP
jgi:glycosyltransferase involved in cell wall biosynthesis